MSIKIKNNNMGMYSPNSINIGICNDGINKGHSKITISDDDLEIYANIYGDFYKEAITELINKRFADCVRRMNEAKTIKELNRAYDRAKHYRVLLKKTSTTNDLEELYNKNKTRINNYSFVKKIIKLFSKGE